MKLTRKELRNIIIEMSGMSAGMPSSEIKYNNLHLKQALHLLKDLQNNRRTSNQIFDMAARAIDRIVQSPYAYGSSVKRQGGRDAYRLDVRSDENIIIEFSEAESNEIDYHLDQSFKILRNMFDYDKVTEFDMKDILTYSNMPGVYGVQEGKARGFALEILRRAKSLGRM